VGNILYHIVTEMKLKLITFDVTNTLLRMRGSVGKHYVNVANKYYGATKQLFDAEQTEKIFVKTYAEVVRQRPNFGYSEGISSEDWWHDVVQKVFSSLGLHDYGIIRSISNQLYSDYCCKEKYELYPEVRDVLCNLKQNYDIKLGIISNFDERLELILEQLEIRNFFDLVLCSRIIGAAKPASTMFTTALALSGGHKPSEALHIGDHIDLDYNAARNAGFNALLIRRKEIEESLRQKSAIRIIASLEQAIDFCN